MANPLEDPPILIMLGPPGSGKGTQAKILQKKLQFTHLSPGSLLRELNESPHKTDKQITELEKMKQGKMVAHWLVYDVMFPRIEEAYQNGRGLIIDGAIRTLEQVDGYVTLLDKRLNALAHVLVIWIDLDEDVARKRMEDRRVVENGIAQRRADDTEEVMKMRFRLQGKEAQKPVLEALADKVPVEFVNGEQTIEDVAKEIQSILKKYHIHEQ